jgi:homoserine O-acetyltransferase
MNDLPLRPAADIGAVEDRFFTLRNFPLTDGTVMPEARIAYETYGRPAPDGRNAILCTHGYTGSHHFAGRNPANGNQPGSWDGLIGPGKAIDTDKLFVVASNMLGSSFGSTNAGSINPQTGEAYGPDFPNITIRDIVAAQKALLDDLGVRHLVAVAGPSYGGYQAFQWAVAYPDSWTRSCRSTPRPGPRSIPTSNWPSCRRGLPAIPTGMAAAITARRRARRC